MNFEAIHVFGLGFRHAPAATSIVPTKFELKCKSPPLVLQQSSKGIETDKLPTRCETEIGIGFFQCLKRLFGGF